MSSVQTSSDSATEVANVEIGEMKLEVVVPVSDVDRAKRFYETLGFRLDIDYVADPDGNGWLLQEVKTRAPGR